MKKNYCWMWLRPLRKDKCAGQCYVAAGKVHGFFGGPAFLRDETMIRSDNRLSYPLLSDLNMVIRTGGCERSRAEYQALYRSASFKLSAAIETPSPTGMTIIEGKPA